MKKGFSFLLLAFSSLLLKAQEYHHLLAKDVVEVEYKFNNKEQMLYLKLTNKGSQKVYAGPENILWFNGLIQVAKQNGGGITLQPGESSSFGMFWNYPKDYKQGYTFKLDNFKVEIGGQGKDPRYSKSTASNKTKNTDPLPAIVFPGDESKSEKSTTPTKEPKNNSSLNKSNIKTATKPDENIKLNGLYYSNGTATQNNPTTNNEANSSNQKEQYQNQLNAINQQYQTKRENNERLFNTLQTGIHDIADILAQNAQRKAEARQRQYEAEREWRRQQLQAEIEDERKKQEEEDKRANEIARQFSIDSTVLSINFETKKTNSISETLDSVYYIGYKRKYDDQNNPTLTLKVFTVYRYSDGTFPLFSTVVEKSKHENNIEQQGISLLIGFFPTKEATLHAISEIQENAKIYNIYTKADMEFRMINQKSNSKTLDKNFWNQ